MKVSEKRYWQDIKNFFCTSICCYRTLMKGKEQHWAVLNMQLDSWSPKLSCHKEHMQLAMVSLLRPKRLLLKISLGVPLVKWTAPHSPWVGLKQWLTHTTKRPLSHSQLVLPSGGKEMHNVTHCCQPWPSYISLFQQPQSRVKFFVQQQGTLQMPRGPSFFWKMFMLIFLKKKRTCLSVWMLVPRPLRAQQTIAMDRAEEEGWDCGWLAVYFATQICFTFWKSSGRNWNDLSIAKERTLPARKKKQDFL